MLRQRLKIAKPAQHNTFIQAPQKKAKEQHQTTLPSIEKASPSKPPGLGLSFNAPLKTSDAPSLPLHSSPKLQAALSSDAFFALNPSAQSNMHRLLFDVSGDGFAGLFLGADQALRADLVEIAQSHMSAPLHPKVQARLLHRLELGRDYVAHAERGKTEGRNFGAKLSALLQLEDFSGWPLRKQLDAIDQRSLPQIHWDRERQITGRTETRTRVKFPTALASNEEKATHQHLMAGLDRRTRTHAREIFRCSKRAVEDLLVEYGLLNHTPHLELRLALGEANQAQGWIEADQYDGRIRGFLDVKTLQEHLKQNKASENLRNAAHEMVHGMLARTETRVWGPDSEHWISRSGYMTDAYVDGKRTKTDEEWDEAVTIFAADLATGLAPRAQWDIPGASKAEALHRAMRALPQPMKHAFVQAVLRGANEASGFKPLFEFCIGDAPDQLNLVGRVLEAMDNPEGASPSVLAHAKRARYLQRGKRRSMKQVLRAQMLKQLRLGNFGVIVEVGGLNASRVPASQ